VTKRATAVGRVRRRSPTRYWPVLRAARGRQDPVCQAVRQMGHRGPFLQAFRPLDVPAPQQAMANRTIIYTPKVHTTARIVDQEITFLHERLSWGIEWELQNPEGFHHAEQKLRG